MSKPVVSVIRTGPEHMRVYELGADAIDTSLRVWPAGTRISPPQLIGFDRLEVAIGLERASFVGQIEILRGDPR